MTKLHYNIKLDIPQDADSARYFIPEGYTARIEDGVLIIEPKESEDERIRKDIISLVNEWWDRTGTAHPEFSARGEMLAYLEKQKEQTEELSTRLNGVMQEYVKAGEDEEEQEHRLKCYQLFWDALEDSEFFEQKEQKPVDYADELKKCKENPLYFYDRYAKIRRKPAEWSESDNIGWDEAFACVTKAEKAAKNEEELQNAVTAEKWLKEIKFKYYVHPVKQEWSEEEERMLNVAIKSCEQTIEDYPNDKVRFKDCIAWLKSLKNRGNFPKSNTNSPWKPSKEQMRCLQTVVQEVNKKSLMSTTGYSPAAVLQSLYIDLKALM